MPSNPKYYIIEASALPDVFLKVAEAKRLLDTGEVATVNEATAAPASAAVPSTSTVTPSFPSTT